MKSEHPVCGRCGVYQNIHPTPRCAKPRREWPWDRHWLRRHVLAWLWIHALGRRARWAIGQYYAGHRARCWCSVFYSIHRADEWDDWRGDYSGDYGCLCDFPMPWSAGPPRPGWCYCPPRVAS
jgi:hypothetical protein